MSSRLLPWLFGLAPALLMLLTWNNHGQTWQLKIYVPTIVIAELATVIVAFLGGMRLRLTASTLLLAALLLLAWGTTLRSPDRGNAIVMTELWSLHLLFGFAAAYLYRASDLIAGQIAGFLLCALLIAILALSAPADFVWVGEMPGLGNPRSFAIYAAVAIALGMGLMASGRTWPVAVMMVAFTLLFWSGSRGGVVATTGALGLGALLFPSMRRARVWGGFAVAAATGAVLAALIGSPPTLFGVGRMAEGSDNGRLALWRQVIELIARQPWLGYGEGQTLVLTGIPWCFHPHNIVLQILLAWGVVGLLLAAILGIWAAPKVIQRTSGETLPLTCVLMTLAAYSLFDGALYNIHTAAVFAACIGLLFASERAQIEVDQAKGQAPISV